MTSNLACTWQWQQLRLLQIAQALLEQRTPRVERAPGRKAEQAGNLGAAKLDALFRARERGVGFRNGGHQRRRVRVRRIADDGLRVG